MEKRKPHYRLNEIQAIVAQISMNAFTQTARANIEPQANRATGLYAETQRTLGRDGRASRFISLGLYSLLMGLTDEQALAVMANLAAPMFFKSMTAERDSRVWQDVYHAPCPNDKSAYIKLTRQAGTVVIQFKEK